MKLRKIIGWILVFVPLLLATVGERYFPTDISIMLMRILMGLGLLSISVVGTCLVSNELPIRIIVEKDEEKMRWGNGNSGCPVYCWNCFNNGIPDKQISQRKSSYYIPLRNRCITSYPKMSSSKIKRTMHM